MYPDKLISLLKTKIADLTSKTYNGKEVGDLKQEVSTIIEVFNKLTGELEAGHRLQKKQEARIKALSDVIVSYNMQDVSVKKKITELEDEMDAFLDAGMNVMAEELRRSEARFKSIYNSRLMGFIFWNAKGEIAEANDYFLELVGYTQEDLLEGKLRWSAITPPEYQKLDEVALEQIRRTGICELYEKEYIRKDGNRVPIAIGAAAIEGEEQKGVAYVIDISQRKKMENEILELNKDLEERVRLRTEQLELVNKELETFSLSVSHDLRAPLRSIHGFSDMLLDGYQDKLDENGIRLLNKIINNAKRMRAIIDELLEFSRLGQQELSKSIVDMDKLVDEVAQELSQTNPPLKKNLSIRPMGPTVGDFNLLKLVYQNLLLNAIKYSSKKETPEIEAGMLEKDGVKTYYVRDNGAGFDMAYYDKLFGVFQRLHRQDEFEGVGLGLAIVQRIVAKHGGKVWAEGQLNEGAIFYFTLESEEPILTTP